MACDVALVSDACPAATAPAQNAGYHAVTVMVTKVNEPGKITLATDTSGGTPQYLVGATLTATAEDGDITDTSQTFTADRAGEVTGVNWRWYRGGTEIPGDDAKDNTYTLTSTDQGHRIRVVVRYQVVGNTNQESASLTTDYPVLATRVGANMLKFDPATVSRTISEGDKDRNVGAPVTATGNHGTIRYSLDDTSGDALAASPKFKIDEKTGQITTAVDLDYEALAAADDNCATRNSCTVTVIATDSTGDSTTGTAPNLRATVTIMITDMDEKPTFSEGPQTIGVPENSTDLYGASNAGYSAAAATDVDYMAADPEGRTVSYSLAGPDASKFQLSGAPPVLSFVSKPDFEAKASADGDNIYEVTVQASADGQTGERMVRVTVSNVDEAPEIIEGGLAVSGSSSERYPENGTDAVGTYMASGPEAASARWMLSGDDVGDFTLSSTSGMSTMLMFSSPPNYEMPMDMGGDNTYEVTLTAMEGDNEATRNVTVTVTDMDEMGVVDLDSDMPMVDMAITATLNDPDSPVSDMDWQWSRSMTMDGTFVDISGATSASYTPVEADDEHYLMVEVMYTDKHGSGKSAMEKTAMAVISNSAPVFADGAMTTRDVAENTAAGMNVDDPVMATDADTDDTLTYALLGMDEMYFDIDSSTGQIMVGADTRLDYETKTSYSVMVTATDDSDASNNMSSINVTINVTDVDEPGMLTLSSMKPVVGTMLTGTLDEGDDEGEVEWQWSRSMTLGGRFTHVDEETRSYTPVDDDVGYYLQVVAKYDDGHGSKILEATTTVVVRTALMVKFDTNENAMIDRNEAIDALRRYLAGDADVSRNEAIAVLRLYLSN